MIKNVAVRYRRNFFECLAIIHSDTNIYIVYKSFKAMTMITKQNAKNKYFYIDMIRFECLAYLKMGVLPMSIDEKNHWMPKFFFVWSYGSSEYLKAKQRASQNSFRTELPSINYVAWHMTCWQVRPSSQFFRGQKSTIHVITRTRPSMINLIFGRKKWVKMTIIDLVLFIRIIISVLYCTVGWWRNLNSVCFDNIWQDQNWSF